MPAAEDGGMETKMSKRMEESSSLNVAKHHKSKTFIKGMDLSSLLEVEECGGKFYDRGKQGDAMDILQRYGCNAVRLRLWVNPYDENGTPYGAGTNDLSRTMRLAKRVLQRKLDFLLDIHYSDFWADPGKQIKPKAWAGLTKEELTKKVYEYTKETMEKLRAEHTLPTMVQVGNELSNGLLWPEGKTPHFDAIASFVNAGIRGVKDVCPDMSIMIHLDNGGNNTLYRTWFDNYFQNGGADFDVIGLSYYPFWHGTLDMLSANMNDIALRYGKDLIVAEVSMGFTTEDYRPYEKAPLSALKGMATREELVKRVPYPMSIKGQCEFMRDFMECIKNVPNGHGKGFYYWEPAWIPVPGSGWATKPSLAYMNDPGPCGNEWANQALFDYEGNALPALETIRHTN